jgi:hypothetical protein
MFTGHPHNSQRALVGSSAPQSSLLGSVDFNSATADSARKASANPAPNVNKAVAAGAGAVGEAATPAASSDVQSFTISHSGSSGGGEGSHREYSQSRQSMSRSGSSRGGESSHRERSQSRQSMSHGGSSGGGESGHRECSQSRQSMSHSGSSSSGSSGGGRPQLMTIDDLQVWPAEYFTCWHLLKRVEPERKYVCTADDHR